MNLAGTSIGIKYLNSPQNTLVLIRTKRNSTERAVTPAIATMILMTATLIFSLVVGEYAFGFLGPTATSVTLSSAALFSGVTSDNVTTVGTSYFQFLLKNPGHSSNISTITMTGTSIATPIYSWSSTPDQQAHNGFTVAGNNFLKGGSTTEYTLCPVTNPAESITVGETYDYVIALSNGQSLSGPLIAQ